TSEVGCPEDSTEARGARELVTNQGRLWNWAAWPQERCCSISSLLESSWLVVSVFPSFSFRCVPRFSLLIYSPKTLFYRSIRMPGRLVGCVLRHRGLSIPCSVRRYIEWI
ncbi:uncharacterized protein, partial [Miscanthus floridulus]|uniref:uncharacterized protein n=1 Tax=Miscanthus floridulus TaxID=154761 RepID=UPI00345A7566